jgi:hypothetical protein
MRAMSGAASHPAQRRPNMAALGQAEPSRRRARRTRSALHHDVGTETAQDALLADAFLGLLGTAKFDLGLQRAFSIANPWSAGEDGRESPGVLSMLLFGVLVHKEACSERYYLTRLCHGFVCSFASRPSLRLQLRSLGQLVSSQLLAVDLKQFDQHASSET